MRRTLSALLVAGALATLPGTALAAPCPEDPETKLRIESIVKDFLPAWKQRVVAPAPPPDLSPRLAGCTRDRLVEALAPELGRIVGYKAGLTAKPTQQRFNTDAPVRGTLLDGMLLENGAALPAAFGARPLWEADMLLVVKDAGINEVTTAEELLKHISAMRPFIELPDLAIAAAAPMNGLVLTAINVGARYGVVGAEVPLEPTPATMEALRTVRIVASGEDGNTLAEATGEATLGHPLNAALWLLGDLAESGVTLKPGDLLSLGSFTPLTPPKSGQAVTVRYEGLPGTPTVSVRFE